MLSRWLFYFADELKGEHVIVRTATHTIALLEENEVEISNG